MTYEVFCAFRGCYLNKPVEMSDVAAAEVLAYSHEQRWKDDPETFLHTVVAKEVNPALSSLTSGSATGDKEGQRG